MGFITKSELNEARMIAKLESRTTWQKGRIINLYCTLHEWPFTPKEGDYYYDRVLLSSISYFKEN